MHSGRMNQSSGVLALRLWRTDQGELQARLMTKLDVADSAPAETSYLGSVAQVDVAVSKWIRTYVESTSITKS